MAKKACEGPISSFNILSIAHTIYKKSLGTEHNY